MAGPNRKTNPGVSNVETGSSGFTLLEFESFSTSHGGNGSDSVRGSNGAFALPFPKEVAIRSDYGWESLELGIFGENVMESGGDLGDAISASVSKESWEAIKAKIKVGTADLLRSNAGTAALAGEGIAINPKKSVLFTGVDHRSFNLEFAIAPLTAGESAAAYEFIKQLHVAVAPDLTGSEVFFTYPDIVRVSIYDGSKLVLDRQECAVTAIDCNLTPDALWATFTDGNPVHIRLTITFKELQLPTKKNARALFGG